MNNTSKNIINDFTEINTDEIFDEFFYQLNINREILGGDVECE